MSQTTIPPLPQAVIDFDDFLNEPDSGENSASPVREFRHRAYRKWQAALSALQGRQAEPGWQPIETIPDTGVFLVYMPAERPSKRMQVANWAPSVKIIGGIFSFDAKPVSHWMPTPAAPSKEPS